jgi:16S rRNA U516 pseudouridylate synthase RsuA-like enzyme
MLEAVGFPVLDLTRKSFGPLRLGNLKPGQFRELGKLEISLLLEAAQKGSESRKKR